MKKISDKRLKKLGGKMPFSSISKKPKPLRKSNPRRKAKRTALYRKMLAGKEYKAARKEAMARAGDQCEMRWYVRDERNNSRTTIRCYATDELHAHHLRYPKSRPLEARDLMILCKPHHGMAEAEKMHKSRIF